MKDQWKISVEQLREWKQKINGGKSNHVKEQINDILNQIEKV